MQILAVDCCTGWRRHLECSKAAYPVVHSMAQGFYGQEALICLPACHMQARGISCV